jgi:hypothetical protein
MVAKAVFLAFIIGNLVPTTAFKFQRFSVSVFQLFGMSLHLSAPDFGPWTLDFSLCPTSALPKKMRLSIYRGTAW